MKISTKLFAISALLASAPAVAVQGTEVTEPVVITVAYENGTLTREGGAAQNYNDLWTSTATAPQLTLATGRNNIHNGTSGPLNIAPGMQAPFTITLATPTDGWEITGFSVDVSGNTGSSIAFGETSFSLGATPQKLSATGLTGSSHVIAFTGTNADATFANFTVTLEVYAPKDEPALEVDEAPAADAGSVMAPTTIVGDRFNTFTTWYHLLDNKDFLTGASATNAGGATAEAYSDEYLYCVVKDGASYTLYNKAAGTAAPVAGAVVSADKLTLNGKEVTPRFAQKFVPVTVEGGTITRNDGNATNKWRNLWTSAGEPTVTFGGSLNNMTTTDSGNAYVGTGDFQLEVGSGSNFTWTFAAPGTNYVADYTFLARKSGNFTEACKVTPNQGAEVALGQYLTRVSGSGYDDTKAASFVQNGINGKGMVMTDAYVTVRRILISVNEREGYAVFPHEGVERRIPALAVVQKGEHEGRLVAIFDYRHDGGDIGFNGNISLQVSVSDDNGATWSTPDFCRDSEGTPVTTFPDTVNIHTAGHDFAYYKADPNRYWNFAFGDAAIVADRESDKLLMLAVGGPVSLWQSRYDKPNQVARWYSEDGGTTWSKAECITYQILDLFNGEPQYGKIDGQFIASGKIMQSRYVKVGDYYRIYAVTATQNNGAGGTTRNYVLYSDDFGQTWAVLGGNDVCPVSTGAGDECKTEELPDGSVLLAGRCRTGNRNFNIFRYTDATEGKGVWMNHVLTDMGFGSINACDGEILVLPVKENASGEQCYLALQSFPYGGGRNYVSIAYKALKSGADIKSPDCFRTWDGRYRVSDRGSVYSTMAWQKNDKLGFFFEEARFGGNSGMYLDFTLEEITDGRYSYQVDDKNEAAVSMTLDLLEIRSHDDDFESKYVGQPIRSEELFNKAVGNFEAAPSYKNYVKANKLQYEGNGVIPVAANGGYRFTSAHNGTYAQLTDDQYMSTDGQTLTVSAEAGPANLFRAIASDENYKFYNSAANVYIAKTPAATETLIPMTASTDEAGVYRVSSNVSGFTNLTCTDPGNASYGAIHMGRQPKIVIWTSGAQASQWYMELVEAPEGYQLPEATEPEYDDYDFNYEENKPQKEVVGICETVAVKPADDSVLFDLQGRRVSKPGRGIFITADGRKVAF